jgi:hypothetical protein
MNPLSHEKSYALSGKSQGKPRTALLLLLILIMILILPKAALAGRIMSKIRIMSRSRRARLR